MNIDEFLPVNTKAVEAFKRYWAKNCYNTKTQTLWDWKQSFEDWQDRKAVK